MTDTAATTSDVGSVPNGVTKQTKITVGLVLALIALALPAVAAVLSARWTAEACATQLAGMAEEVKALSTEIGALRTQLAVQQAGQRQITELKAELIRHEAKQHPQCRETGATIYARLQAQEAVMAEFRDRLRDVERRAPK